MLQHIRQDLEYIFPRPGAARAEASTDVECIRYLSKEKIGCCHRLCQLSESGAESTRRPSAQVNLQICGGAY